MEDISILWIYIFFYCNSCKLSSLSRRLPVPRIQFKDPFYTIHEEDGMLSAILVRSGDVSQRSAVRCYTRQMSARAGIDYYERSNSDDDVVIFEADEKTQECRVAIVDDSFYERNEEFRLVLGQTQLQYGFGKSLIGKRSQTTVMIVDNNDRMFKYFSLLWTSS